MKLRPVHLLLVALIVGSFLRLYQLGNWPLGLSWDEAAITYDAWGIADWHRDQHADFMPLVFKSFGDYKPPLMHYVLGTVFKVVEVNTWMIRLVSALAGIVLIAVMYFLARELLKDHPWVAGVSALLVAISPWSVHMSRIGFEANSATTMVALGVLLFLWGLRKWYWMAVSVLMLAASVYMYQSTKIVAPLMIAWLLIIFIRQIKAWKKYALLIVSGFGFLMLPLLVSIKDGSLGRGQQALLFFDDEGDLLPVHLSFVQLIKNALTHVSANFLVLGKQENVRNAVPGYGILYIVDVIFLVLGIFKGWLLERKAVVFLLGWIVIGLVPSIISTLAPHAIRSATIVPALYILIGWGVVMSWQQVRRSGKQHIERLFLVLVVIAYGFSLLMFARFYAGEYQVLAAKDFQYGYEEALLWAREELKTADRLVVTDAYGQPYIYTLLYFGHTPEQFHAGSLANVSFKPVDWPNNEEDTVFVATPDEIPVDDGAVVDVVVIPGTDEVVFVLARK